MKIRFHLEFDIFSSKSQEKSRISAKYVCITFARYCSNKEQYDRHSDILEKAIEDLNENDPVAPNTQHINEQDAAAKTKPSELFGCFDPGTNKQHSQYDLFDGMGILPRHNDEEELVQNRLNDSDYRQLVRSLNIKQKEFFYHVLHSIKTKDDPLALFLSGGAGVGKSTVTNALYEALVRYLNSVPGKNPDEVKVLKSCTYWQSCI